MHLGRRVCIAPRPRQGNAGAKRFEGRFTLAMFGVRLAKLLVRCHLIVGMVGDQGPQQLTTFPKVSLPQALERQSISQERVAGIFRQTPLQHFPPW